MRIKFKTNASLCMRRASIFLGLLVCTTVSSPASRIAFVGLLPAEPDVFVPGFGWEAEVSLTRSLGVWTGGAYFLSGTRDLEAGIHWHRF